MNNSDTPSLSKNAVKKQKKREKLERLREERRATRKQRKKEAKEKRKANGDQGRTDEQRRSSTRKEDKERLRQAQLSGIRVVIDLSWAHLMTTKEIGSLCRQLTVIYTENKRSTHPFHLYFTSLSGPFKEAFEKFSPTYGNWIVDVYEESYLEIFADEKTSLVYLSADATSDIRTYTTDDDTPVPFKKETILVIGGLIDRNRHKNACFEESRRNGIAAAYLPLHLLENRNKGLKVLTTNQCLEMLLRYNETLDWTTAVTATFPKRKTTAQAKTRTPDIASPDQKSSAHENNTLCNDDCNEIR